MAKYRPDLSSPRVDDPVWMSGFNLLIDQARREAAYETAAITLSMHTSSALFLLMEAVRGNHADKAAADGFINRAKSVGLGIESAHHLGMCSVGALDRNYSAAEAKDKEQSKAFAEAASMWEGYFGKRGDPVVEAKVLQTEAILQAKIKEALEAKKAKASGARTNKRRRRH